MFILLSSLRKRINNFKEKTQEIFGKIKANSITKSQLLDMYIEKTTETKARETKQDAAKTIETEKDLSFPYFQLIVL